MKYSIKRKLFLGLGFQFLMVVASVAMGIAAVHLLTTDTQNILRDNYKTLEYCHAMALAIDDHEHPQQAVEDFRANLQKQENNVTEPGEMELTKQLAAYFQEFVANPADPEVQRRIRSSLHAITKMNMEAIERKSELAQQTAGSSNFMMGTVGTMSFIFAFILLLNLPASIADPIKEFTESIQQIAKKNYAWRINDLRNDEFGAMAKSFNLMATELQAYESSNVALMMFEKKRMETLINQMHNPVIGLNHTKTILFANSAALKILNLKSEDLIGKSAEAVAQQNDLLRTLIATGANASRQTPLKIYADNKESFFEKELVKVIVPETNNPDGKYIGDVIILQNITPYKELDAAKTNFIATVSHEFKTPIASIEMSLQLLHNPNVGTLNTEQQNLLLSMQDDLERLLKITSELLDFTQVESGQIHLNILPTQLEKVIDYALNATRSQAEQKHIRLELRVPKQLPPVLADIEKTAWVLTNLISNATRYSYEHSAVQIHVKEAGEHFRIEVKDSGQGIAPQYQAKVFERYFRVPGTLQQGSGLGLAISKEFIEAQGGQIGMESDFGAGSTFWFELHKA